MHYKVINKAHHSKTVTKCNNLQHIGSDALGNIIITSITTASKNAYFYIEIETNKLFKYNICHK